MIEHQFISQKMKEFMVRNYIASKLAKTGYARTEIKRTPLGDKVIIYTTRPGLVVGQKGENIKNMTEVLKKKYGLENPQIEIGEVENQYLDVNSVADRIAYVLEKFGSKRFKAVGYKTLQNIMDSGALGAEIIISGKVPSSRAKSWRFSAGYLKKSGDISANYVKRTHVYAKLKSGIVGIKVSIMLPDTPLPDKIVLLDEDDKKIKVEEVEEKKKTKPETEKKKVKKKSTKKEDGSTKK